MTKLTQKEMDDNFHEWLADLVAEEGIPEFVKKPIVEDLWKHRHVVIVDGEEFFSEAKDSEEVDLDLGQYVIFSRVHPTMFIEQFEDLNDAVEFCEECGITYQMMMAPVSGLLH